MIVNHYIFVNISESGRRKDRTQGSIAAHPVFNLNFRFDRRDIRRSLRLLGNVYFFRLVDPARQEHSAKYNKKQCKNDKPD